jgi:cytochrome c-type biogenesis protein CcmH/NrfF
MSGSAADFTYGDGFVRYSHRVLSILAWWAIPVGAVILAAAVSALARRVRRPSDDETISAYRRFREAIGNAEEQQVEATPDV